MMAFLMETFWEGLALGLVIGFGLGFVALPVLLFLIVP